jgi:hypothetical protein
MTEYRYPLEQLVDMSRHTAGDQRTLDLARLILARLPVDPPEVIARRRREVLAELHRPRHTAGS